MAACELTHLEQRQPIDMQRVRDQLSGYAAFLRHSGYRLQVLPADDNLPDCVFIEDPAVVFDECVVMARSGASSRRPEGVAVRAALEAVRGTSCPFFTIEEPGTLDGGDVLVLGKLVLVGSSSRTNEAAFRQLSAFLAPFHYTVVQVPVQGVLHLKTAMTALDDLTLLANTAHVDVAMLESIKGFPLRVTAVEPSEGGASNVVRVGGKIVADAQFAATNSKLRQAGYDVVELPFDELAKAEGSLTCTALLFQA
jgi:dimethylargininase